MTAIGTPGPVSLDLDGRTALVTGAAGGIGRACALRLAAAGATVRAVDRDTDGLTRLVADHPNGAPGRIEPCPLVFEHGQIALLAAHAAHAAVAIDTANLLAETRKTLTELEAANEIIRDRSAVIERASDVHDRLTELVLRGGGVQDVAGAVAEVLHGEVEFTEPGGAPAEALDRSRADGHAVRDGADWVAAVGTGGEVLGALVLRGHPALDPVDQRTLERAAMVTSLLLLARRTAGEAEQRVRGELLDDLLNAADRDPRLLRERAARVGADLDAPHVVLAARTDGPRPDDAHSHGTDRHRLRSAASHLAATRRGLAAVRDGGAVLLLPLGPDDDPAHTAFVHRTLGAVTDYDARRGTELLRTLGAYFACGMSPARTKDALHVHVNTVAQRLDRVSRLLGPDWQTPARALEIQLALRLHQLSSAVAGHTGA
ncbi:hypothetical protein DDE74_06420 [Streptomyces lydicus]|uniref:PucR family transcriptional regulator n=1 Tax=Streptomyces lydicus TaxID=47763 RepID=A0A3S9Y6I7_9ACTN|nr:hypothetical protein DDE74_06420 [Streptomyces lydicus]